MITEITREISQVPLPLPKVDVTVRRGVLSDLPFIDSLQKLHTKQVGWMPTKQLEGKIAAGQVLVAEEMMSDECGVQSEESFPPSLCTPRSSLRASSVPVGYCIGQDQYFKRDDVGIIYQMNVLPGRQRGLIGATLLKAMFERAAWGCKLFCCWCAQDIEANRFWEAMGFVPLAFRAGSEKKSRIHIFWQKRIRSGDATTPWWFPSKTNSGAIREDRIVLPIGPGTHWSEVKPLVLPTAGVPTAGVPTAGVPGGNDECGMMSDESRRPAELSVVETRASKARGSRKRAAVEKPAAIRRNGLCFDIPMQGEVLPEAKKEPKPPRVKAKRVKVRNDPRLVAAARELRDRWLEHVNDQRFLPDNRAKYEVCRQMDGRRIAEEQPALPWAA